MTDQDTYLVVTERISQSPLALLGQRVLLDSDLVEFYNVSTKRFNEKGQAQSGALPSGFRVSTH